MSALTIENLLREKREKEKKKQTPHSHVRMMCSCSYCVNAERELLANTFICNANGLKLNSKIAQSHCWMCINWSIFACARVCVLCAYECEVSMILQFMAFIYIG